MSSLRYWDGYQWTEQRAPRPAHVATAPAVDPGRGWAIASLVLGLVGIPLFWLWGVMPLLAFVFAMQSRAKSKGAGLRFSGMAIAGMLLGLLGLLLAVSLFGLATLLGGSD